MAPILSILTNFLEMKGAMNLMAFYQKRYQAIGASGIGTWKGIAEVIIRIFTLYRLSHM
jgi:hypothetical protein